MTIVATGAGEVVEGVEGVTAAGEVGAGAAAVEGAADGASTHVPGLLSVGAVTVAI